MHEMAIVTSLLDIVCKRAEEVGAEKITSMTILCGEMRDIHEEMFQKFVDWFSKGTKAEGAEVQIKFIPLQYRCRECGTVYGYDLKRGIILDEEGNAIDSPEAKRSFIASDQLNNDSSYDGNPSTTNQNACRGDLSALMQPTCLLHPDAQVDIISGNELLVADITVT